MSGRLLNKTDVHFFKSTSQQDLERKSQGRQIVHMRVHQRCGINDFHQILNQPLNEQIYKENKKRMAKSFKLNFQSLPKDHDKTNRVFSLENKGENSENTDTIINKQSHTVLLTPVKSNNHSERHQSMSLKPKFRNQQFSNRNHHQYSYSETFASPSYSLNQTAYFKSSQFTPRHQINTQKNSKEKVSERWKSVSNEKTNRVFQQKKRYAQLKKTNGFYNHPINDANPNSSKDKLMLLLEIRKRDKYKKQRTFSKHEDESNISGNRVTKRLKWSQRQLQEGQSRFFGKIQENCTFRQDQGGNFCASQKLPLSSVRLSHYRDKKYANKEIGYITSFDNGMHRELSRSDVSPAEFQEFNFIKGKRLQKNKPQQKDSQQNPNVISPWQFELEDAAIL